MKRSRFSPVAALAILSLCLVLVLPAPVAAQGRQAPDPGFWSSFLAGPLAGFGEVVDSAAQAMRSFWSGLKLPNPPKPPPKSVPNGDNGGCVDPDGRPLPCKPGK